MVTSGEVSDMGTATVAAEGTSESALEQLHRAVAALEVTRGALMFRLSEAEFARLTEDVVAIDLAIARLERERR